MNFLKKLIGIKEKKYHYYITITYTNLENALYYSLELVAENDYTAKINAIKDFKYTFSNYLNTGNIKIVKIKIDSKKEYDKTSEDIF